MSMDFLEAVEEQLVAATERGVRRRRWRWPWLMRQRLPWRAPTAGIAAGVAAALAASAIAATLTLPSSQPKHAATVTGLRAAAVPAVHSFTTSGNVPAGFNPESFTAISEFTWWLLGTAPCSGHSCTTIVRTTDGGPEFTRIAAPPTTLVGNVRFANNSDGYVYGQQLWSTHDGGKLWTQQKLGTSVDDLQIADGYVYAIVYNHGAHLMTSSIDADNWSTVGGVGKGYLSGLWVQGTTVFIQSGSHLLVSTDSGASFSRVAGVHRADNCSYDGGTQALWAVCSTGMAPDEVLLSTNSGNSFTTAAQVPDGPIDSFAAATASVAVASGQGPLYRTVNAGASWTRVRSAPSANWVYLGFTDMTHGVALGEFGGGNHQDDRLYYTIDAGASYHRVPIGP